MYHGLLFAPGSPLFECLEPFDLIKIHTSLIDYICSRAAVPKLNVFQAAASTAAHANMFQAWLESPRLTKSNDVFK